MQFPESSCFFWIWRVRIGLIKKIAEAFDCRRQTVENVRECLVNEGFQTTLNGKKRETPPRKKLLDGEQEAKLIALRLGSPPDGFGNWQLRLIAE